ncbi:hypothetical protein V493_07552, partial [Pseudogymnoascus sp. VKM F-4281 (FW-2241)]
CRGRPEGKDAVVDPCLVVPVPLAGIYAEPPLRPVEEHLGLSEGLAVVHQQVPKLRGVTGGATG